jgi:predicted DNA-binding mobile mystery protein A
MNKRLLQIQQLNSKMQVFDHLTKVAQPPTGWVKAVRTTLGMSLLQLGNKLNISKQSVQNLEKREHDGTISIKALREAASALDMELVYGFVPKDGSLDALIERKAKQLAIQIVRRTSNSMKLEDQENSKSRLEKAVEERKLIIKTEIPKSIWD